MKAMSKFGGGFVKALAQVAYQADPNNLEKIKKSFPEYWAEYEDMGKHLKEKN